MVSAFYITSPLRKLFQSFPCSAFHSQGQDCPAFAILDPAAGMFASSRRTKPSQEIYQKSGHISGPKSGSFTEPKKNTVTLQNDVSTDFWYPPKPHQKPNNDHPHVTFITRSPIFWKGTTPCTNQPMVPLTARSSLPPLLRPWEKGESVQPGWFTCLVGFLLGVGSL